ncbi:MAG: DNA sulfur modification protein DndB [Snowella sp.]|nr:DNA sulfur modification protein DndB [Snowella sp.]
MELTFNAIPILGNPKTQECNYLASVLYGDIAQLIIDSRLYVPHHAQLPDLAQRKPNPSRIKQIANYILENYQSGSIYFPPICVNLYPKPRYEKGKIYLPYHSLTMRLTDGQHRCFGIHHALSNLEKNDKTQHKILSQLQIGVLIYSALPLELERQAFRDQNLLVQRPSVSLSHYFDQRSPHVQIAKQLIDQIPQFQNNVEAVENSLGNQNPKLLTLSTLVTAIQFNFPNLKTQDELPDKIEWSIDFWTTIANTLPADPWRQASTAERQTQRQQQITVSAVLFQALGMIAHDLYQEKVMTEQLGHYLNPLKTLDWNKENRFWLDRGVTQIGTTGKPIISNTRTTVKLFYQVLKEHLGLIVSPK